MDSNKKKKIVTLSNIQQGVFESNQKKSSELAKMKNMMGFYTHNIEMNTLHLKALKEKCVALDMEIEESMENLNLELTQQYGKFKAVPNSSSEIELIEDEPMIQPEQKDLTLVKEDKGKKV